MNAFPPLRSILAVLAGITAFAFGYEVFSWIYRAWLGASSPEGLTGVHVHLLVILPLSVFIGAMVTGLITSLEGWWLAAVWFIPASAASGFYFSAILPRETASVPLIIIMVVWILIGGFLGADIGGAIARLYRETGGGIPREVLQGPRQPTVNNSQNA